MTLGEKIQQLRKNNSLSQESLAEKLEISRQAISKWELGESIPDSDKIVQLSKFFKVSTDFLLFDNIDKYAAPILNENDKQIEKPTENNNLYRNFLGKWVKIFFNDKEFQGFYQIAVIAINNEYILFKNIKGKKGILTIENIQSISEADIYKKTKDHKKIPEIVLEDAYDNNNLLKTFIGNHCQVHFTCKSLFTFPQGIYDATVNTVTEDNILVEYNDKTSVIMTKQLLTLIER
jgi:transcriptional regulator with XRE-family HTH domain